MTKKYTRAARAALALAVLSMGLLGAGVASARPADNKVVRAELPPMDIIDDFIASGQKLQLRLVQEQLQNSQEQVHKLKLSEVERALNLLDRDDQPVRQDPGAAPPAPKKVKYALQVQNHTPFRVYVYVDKVLVGWVDGDTIFVIKGFVPGYYVFYGRTHFGAASWGPFLVYIPGVHHLW
jgi:hypothetical protein